MQQRFEPGFFDRLLGEVGSHRRMSQGMTADEIRESVALDLEALLNTRCTVEPALLESFPRVRQSVIAFGMPDYSSMSLVKPEDRADICRSLELAIDRHEPRLQQVRVELAPESRDSKRLCFRIQAVLALSELRESINFNAMLHPITQHYDVDKV